MNEDLLNEIDMQLAEVGQLHIMHSLFMHARLLGDISTNNADQYNFDKVMACRAEVFQKLADQDLEFFSTWARFSLPDLTDEHCAKLHESLIAMAPK